MCRVGQITKFRDPKQLSGVKIDTTVAGTFALNDEPKLSCKVFKPAGLDLPGWTITSDKNDLIGEGYWTVLDHGYIKFTGKLDAKKAGLEDAIIFPGTLNIKFSPMEGPSVIYHGRLYFKIIQDQVVGLSIPVPNADRLSENYSTDADALFGKILTGSIVANDKAKIATLEILNLLDPDHKLWSCQKKDEVTNDFGDIAGSIESILFLFPHSINQALAFDGSSFKKVDC